MSHPKQKVAVVTGANRGIGFEICRQLAQQGILVVLTSRDEKKGLAACQQLDKKGLAVRYLRLDVTQAADHSRLSQFIKKDIGRCDILINNAGIFIDEKEAGGAGRSSIFALNLETLRKTMETNAYGSLLLSQVLVPFMKENHYGRIVNLSSGLGQLSDMGSGYGAYRISKTAINAITRILNAELAGTNVLVNSMCPGWV